MWEDDDGGDDDDGNRKCWSLRCSLFTTFKRMTTLFAFWFHRTQSESFVRELISFAHRTSGTWLTMTTELESQMDGGEKRICRYWGYEYSVRYDVLNCEWIYVCLMKKMWCTGTPKANENSISTKSVSMHFFDEFCGCRWSSEVQNAALTMAAIKIIIYSSQRIIELARLIWFFWMTCHTLFQVVLWLTTE